MNKYFISKKFCNFGRKMKKKNYKINNKLFIKNQVYYMIFLPNKKLEIDQKSQLLIFIFIQF